LNKKRIKKYKITPTQVRKKISGPKSHHNLRVRNLVIKKKMKKIIQVKFQNPPKKLLKLKINDALFDI
jgi:hypothetical protein